MRYVHLHHIVHRDLKPDNILIDGNWRGLIGDFGLSRTLSGEGPPTDRTGTPLYAAPEQLIRHFRYTEKVDVFAFGLILYEILGHVPAFPRGRPAPFPDIPSSFGPLMHELIPRCWSLTSTDRPSFEEIFDSFSACKFAILPGADGEAISRSVSEVLELEKQHPSLRKPWNRQP
jgi:serine/threonine protein kinase